MKVRMNKEKLQIEKPIDRRHLKELEIYKKYPKLFRQKDLPMSQTCMCWGIAVGWGWLDIIDRLCSQIQNYIDKNNLEQVEFTQIKEKFGLLRIYSWNADDNIDKMIEEAELESSKTCEECGTAENVTTEGGYILTLCDRCRSKRK